VVDAFFDCGIGRVNDKVGRVVCRLIVLVADSVKVRDFVGGPLGRPP
jgi:hypothetical protein